MEFKTNDLLLILLTVIAYSKSLSKPTLIRYINNIHYWNAFGIAHGNDEEKADNKDYKNDSKNDDKNDDKNDKRITQNWHKNDVKKKHKSMLNW